jgi:hypothetical protein
MAMFCIKNLSSMVMVLVFLVLSRS